MAKIVSWTPEAQKTFEQIISYLEENWTLEDVIHLIDATDRVVNLILTHPRMFRKTNIENVHEALVTSHNLLIYKVYDDRIDLLIFWDTRQNPKKKKYPTA